MDERILIVEDEEALRVALSDRLETAGYVVETASDGARDGACPFATGMPSTGGECFM